MGKRVDRGLRPVDVPQSDSLPTIRVILAHVAVVGGHVGTISESASVSDRHVRYRLQSARVLGWLDDERTVTPRGRALLDTKIGSRQERDAFRAAIAGCRVVSMCLPNNISADDIDLDSLARKIGSATGLSFETAHRRARVLRSWLKQLRESDRVSK